MSAALILGIAIVMVATSFLSGLFGMAGGLVLVGMLMLVLPLPTAMALHAVTQIASNVWRAVFWRRHISWRIAAAYLAGCVCALGAWSVWRWVPSVPLALIALGVVPFLTRLVPARLRPVPERPLHGIAFGAVCMTLMLLTGVAGAVLDRFFLDGRLDRRGIVATKGVCQVGGHGLKLAYFGALIDRGAAIDPWLAAIAVVASLAGTALSRKFLEAMPEDVYRRWAGRLVALISAWYVAQGAWLAAV
jgi:uncharacterized membrane protein YfcA